MSRRRNNKSGNAFWVGYSDLMTSLFFVFLVVATTLALGFRYQASIYEADAKELARIREIASAAERLTDDSTFYFNAAQSRFELRNDFQYEEETATIPLEAHASLIAAGRKIQDVLASVEGKGDVRFKVVIEGRAARFLEKGKRGLNADRYGNTKDLSYRRALALAKLWEANGIDLMAGQAELFIAGSGFEGKGRYAEREEELNKQIIVQVIPFLSPDE